MTYLRAKSVTAVGADYRHDDDDEITAARDGSPPPPPPPAAAQPKRLPPPRVLLLQKRILRQLYDYVRRRRRRARLLVPRPPASTRQRPRSFGLVCQSPTIAGPWLQLPDDICERRAADIARDRVGPIVQLGRVSIIIITISL